jgi:hypothetical protein
MPPLSAFKRPLFHQRHFVVEEDLVKLSWLETRNLDQRIFQNQFLDFDLELVEVPAGLSRWLTGLYYLPRGVVDCAIPMT